MELTDIFLDSLCGNYCPKKIQHSLNLLELEIKRKKNFINQNCCQQIQNCRPLGIC
ncbi:hypothetical protein PMF13cell1_01483 [Blautia producta]|uniref:Uncharacterized protein n=1 Tax=Blautia producta TaxID=33035 RepID=A0A4P6LYD6_9FIRM|nr:hypothetical protein PMF13cell1_01483 [Blautia producta]